MAKKYAEIQKAITGNETGLLDKQLKTLLAMETIKKTEPINSKGSKRKRFYKIMDNLMRFYFTFIYGQAGNSTA